MMQHFGSLLRRLGLALVVAGAFAAPAAAAEPTRLSLADALARARSNPLARAANERTRAASAQLDEARGLRFPRGEVTSFIAPSPVIHCEDPGCTRTDPTDLALRFHGAFGGVRVQVLQPLYTFGKIDSAVDAAASAERANEALARGVSFDLELETARAYYGVELARELSTMLGDGVDKVKHAVDEVDARLERGEAGVTVQDRLRLQAFGAEIRARQSEAAEAAATALYGLRALVGDANADTLDVPLDAIDFEPSEVRSYVERALRSRPELAAAREGVRALESLADLERARFYPDFALVGMANWAKAGGTDNPPSAFANDPFNTSSAEAAVVLRWTLDPVSQAARAARANAEVERARALENAAERGASFAVLQAYTRVRETRTRLEAARTGEKGARGWVASVMQADAVGTISARDIADAYLAYFTLHGRLLQSTFDFNVAVFSLRRAFGDAPVPPQKP